MGVRLDWQMGDDAGDSPPPRRWGPTSRLTLATVLLLVLLLALGWFIWQREDRRSATRLERSVQAHLDAARTAYLRGDGDLFLANFEDDAALRAAQLLPENQIPYRAGLRVSRVEQHGEEVWANVEWQNAGTLSQRIYFFRREAGQLIQIPPDEASYWQGLQERSFTWGTLRYDGVDAVWSEQIGSKIADLLQTRCAMGCPPEVRPLTLTLAPDYRLTAEPRQVRVPSPRIVQLDDRGQPGPRFWDLLETHLVDYAAPSVIRFAVPALYVPQYAELAPEFEQLHPGFKVEIVPLDSDASPAEQLQRVDGMLYTPTPALLAAGSIRDVTDLAYSDPNFDLVDFYEQVWRAGWWQDRMWLVPQGAGMPLIYYNLNVYRQASMPLPSVRWTWAEMETDLANLAGYGEQEDLRAILLDEDRELLFSYAYSWENERCQSRGGKDCIYTELSTPALVAAYSWYEALSQQPQLLADLALLPPDERAGAARAMRAFNQIAIWTSDPVNFEEALLRASVGIVPFPGSDRFDGITPLSVQGAVISAQSSRPRATWYWLSYLTNYPVARQLRHVPARPSVAQRSGFWRTLPHPLDDVMRTAFPFARAIRLAEQDLFAWSQLAQVAGGTRSPAQAARAARAVRWFTQP